MAIGAGAVWEFRTTGSNSNSGGYDASIAGAGTDYSQQDAAQLSLTDCACTQNSTTVTSATGGFTAAMIGNAIYFSSGTNFLVQPFFITAVTDTNTITVDRTPCTAGNGTSGAGAVGGARALPTDAFLETFAAGNVAWVKYGTYTTGASISVATGIGTTSARIRHVGYKTTRGDAPTGSDRPTLTCSANALTFGAYTSLENFIITISNSAGVSFGTAGIIKNCKVTQGAGNTCVTLGTDSRAIGVETVSGATGISSASTALAQDCYIHGASTIGCGAGKVIGCVISGCGTGISGQAAEYIRGCTIYNCTTGINLQGFTSCVVSGNIISGCTTGLAQNAASSNWLEHNIWHNTTNFSNASAGDTDTIADPLLNNPGGGDFTLQAASAAIGALRQLSNAGLTGTYPLNIGADQGDHVTAGSANIASW